MSMFVGEGLKLDCSVHALACPVAPQRVENWPAARHCGLERAWSHPESLEHDFDTEKISKNEPIGLISDTGDIVALRNAHGAVSVSGTRYFQRINFCLLDSSRMRSEPGAVLVEVGLIWARSFEFDLEVRLQTPPQIGGH